MRDFNFKAEYKKLLTPEVVAYLTQIHEYKGQQNLFIETKADELSDLLEVAKIQSTEASNCIEGIVTTNERLKKIVREKTIPRNRSEKEIAGYRDVLATIHESHDFIPPKPSIILQLHRDLYKYSGKSIGGSFKNSDNVIAEELPDGRKIVRFEPVSAWETPGAMESLCDAFQTAAQDAELDPLLLIPIFILDFLCIHPFNDGNGRMSRLLTLLLLYRSGYLVGKYISIEKLISDTKETYYEALQEAVTGAMLELDGRCRPQMLVFLPQQAVVPVTQTPAMTISGTALYNHTGGYGSYLIPAVLMIIIFQTLLMVIGMIGGGERATGSIRRFAACGLSWGGMARVVAGKTFVYCMLYALFSVFLLGLLPVLFSLPDIGDKYRIAMLMIPYLMATSFFGLAATVFFTDSEAPVLMIAFFSVGLIFLSGVSYPLELMPWYWKAAHFVFPAAPGTLAFIKLNSMGASMADIRTEYLTLWVQCAVYFVLACMAYRRSVALALRTDGFPPDRSLPDKCGETAR